MNFHRKFAGLVAGIMTIACLAQPISVIAETTDSYDMNVTVNLAGEKKAISPYIYGINQYSSTNNFKNITVNAAR